MDYRLPPARPRPRSPRLHPGGGPGSPPGASQVWTVDHPDHVAELREPPARGGLSLSRRCSSSTIAESGREARGRAALRPDALDRLPRSPRPGRGEAPTHPGAPIQDSPSRRRRGSTPSWRGIARTLARPDEARRDPLLSWRFRTSRPAAAPIRGEALLAGPAPPPASSRLYPSRSFRADSSSRCDLPETSRRSMRRSFRILFMSSVMMARTWPSERPCGRQVTRPGRSIRAHPDPIPGVLEDRG